MNRKNAFGPISPAAVSGLVLTAVLLLFSGPGRAADRIEKVLILPFTLNAAQEMGYVREGILDMLSSRLSWEGRVQVLDKTLSSKAAASVRGELTDDAARALARDFGADYVLYGSMTVFGQAVSLDAKIIGLDPTRPPMAVHAQSDRLDGVIARVSDFAGDINSKVFKREAEARRETTEQRTPAEYRRHPDTLLSRTQPSAGLVYSDQGLLSGEGFWKSSPLPVAITGMDVGDVDGDGANEIVYSSINEVFVGRIQDGRFRLITHFKGSTGDRFVTLDVGDINGNGRAEIFVNCQRKFDTRSYVLEWTGSSLKAIVQDSNWYYRIIPSPSGPILIGQESRGGDSFFYGPIYQMRPGQGGYVPAGPLEIPKNKGNVLSLGLVKFAGENQESVVFIGADSSLNIFSTSGQVLWEGKEKFGGSVFYLEKPEAGNTSVAFNQDVYYYIPPRIVVADADGDGQPEMIIASSERSSWSNLMPNTRTLQKGGVSSQVFAQMSLREIWHSPLMAGYPVDYQIKDYNNDGQPEMIMAILISNPVSLLGKPQSMLVAFSLSALRAEKQKSTTK
jgi:TolB-like protein